MIFYVATQTNFAEAASSTEVTIHVQNQDGEPLQRYVTITDAYGDVVASAETDDKGDFKTSLPDGDYRVIVFDQLGYDEVSSAFTLPDTTNVTIVLFSFSFAVPELPLGSITTLLLALVALTLSAHRLRS